MVSLGKSEEGRDVWMVIASKERAFTPEALRKTGKPIVLAQGGIHAGEIEGKDAGLMLLRDMTVRGTKRELLDGANFLFVPIFNVDGHERFNRWFRINQRGPEEGGWRTNARNFNLNRDYMKADTEEMRAMIRASDVAAGPLHRPSCHRRRGLSVRRHVRLERRRGPFAGDRAWLDASYRRDRRRGTGEAGHIPGPLIFTDDPLAGIALGQATRACRTAMATRATSHRSWWRTIPSSPTTSASSACTSSSSTRCARSRASSRRCGGGRDRARTTPRRRFR